MQHFADKHSTLKRSATSMPGSYRRARLEKLTPGGAGSTFRRSESFRTLSRKPDLPPSRENITPSNIAEIVAHRSSAVLISRYPRLVGFHSRHTP